MPQPSLVRKIQGLSKLPKRNRAVDFDVLLITHLAGGIILRHDVDVSIRPEFLGDPVEDLTRAGNLAGMTRCRMMRSATGCETITCSQMFTIPRRGTRATKRE